MKVLTIAAAAALVGVQLLSAEPAKAQPLDIKVNGRRVERFEPAVRNSFGDFSPNLIGGDAKNGASRGVQGATIGGGGGGGQFQTPSALPNRVQGDWGTIGGGAGNIVGAPETAPEGVSFSTVAGGERNAANGHSATVGGGANNTANDYAVVAGGTNNAAFAFSTVGGGYLNTAHNNYSTVAGGAANTADGNYSMVPGGVGNHASGATSFAAGNGAKAVHDGAFVWADFIGATVPFSSSAANEFDARATGGVNFVSGIDGSGNATAGVSLAPGGGSWGSISDRNLKDNFAPVDARELLERLARMPIRTWNYKAQPKSIRHVGPTAQDFRAAFKVGEDDRHITAVDADGVALAAIQGLYKMLQEKDAELRALRAQQAVMAAQIDEVSVFKARLDSLERRADLTRVSYTARPALQPH